MVDTNKRVREFYDGFKQNDFISDTPNLDHPRIALKTDLVAEEFFELTEAVYGKAAEALLKQAWIEAKKLDDGTRNVVRAADATSDLRYVIEGFDLEAGIPSEAIFEEVHLSNMKKLDANGEPIMSDGVTPAPDGEVKPFGKILKGPDYFEPDLEAIIEGRTPDRTPLIKKNK